MKALITLASLVILTVLGGATLTVFWDWFIAGPEAPFTGMPQLSMVDALGLSLVVSLLTHQHQPSPSDRGPGTLLVERIVSNVASLGVIWIIAVVLHVMQG